MVVECQDKEFELTDTWVRTDLKGFRSLHVLLGQ